MNRFRRHHWLIAIYLFTFSTVTNVQAESKRILVVTETWPPFRIVSADKQYGGYSGIDIDLLKVLSDKLGVQFKVQRLPWARCLEHMRTGQADLITGLAYTEQRAEFIRYSVLSYYSVSPVFYALKNRGHLIRKYEDLYNYRIGYSINSAYFEPFNSDTKLNKIGVSTEKQLLRMLTEGRLRVIIGTNPNLAYDIAQQNLKDRVELTTYVPIQKTELFLGISRKSKFMARADELDDILGNLVRSGAVLRLSEKYF